MILHQNFQLKGERGVEAIPTDPWRNFLPKTSPIKMKDVGFWRKDEGEGFQRRGLQVVQWEVGRLNYLQDPGWLLAEMFLGRLGNQIF